MASVVSRISAATAECALEHFAARLSFETDCWDVHHAMSNERQDFVLLDVRSEEYFQKGHVPGAVNLPHWKINESTLATYPVDTLFVVYCAGPHCNGANKGAIALAKLGRPVKEMIGGAIGWTDEGFELVSEPSEAPASGHA
ncbi:MAG: rhodanese-like domain-containing protein [Planctomycetota bacterium]